MERLALKACLGVIFFFNDTATTEIYTLSLHDALPISPARRAAAARACARSRVAKTRVARPMSSTPGGYDPTVYASYARSEEHTPELQSRQYLVCRLLLEKKKIHTLHSNNTYLSLLVLH